MIIDISRFLKRSQNRCRRQERRRGLEWGVGVHSSCSPDFFLQVSSSGVWGSAVDLTALTMPSFKLINLIVFETSASALCGTTGSANSFCKA